MTADLSSPSATEIRHRLNRVEGQVRGIQRMLDEGRPCEDVVTQLLAARRALDGAMRTILTERIAECMATLPPDEARDSVARAISLLTRD